MYSKNNNKFKFKVDGYFIVGDKTKDEFFVSFKNWEGKLIKNDKPYTYSQIVAFIESKEQLVKEEHEKSRKTNNFVSFSDVDMFGLAFNCSAEDEYFKNIQLKKLEEGEVKALTNMQRDRIYKHFISGKSISEIARNESSNKSSVSRSIKLGLANLENFLKNF